MKNVIEDIEKDNNDYSSYIDKLVKELRDDQEVYEIIKPLNLNMKQVKDNIAKLTEFKNDYNYCKQCPGLDYCKKDNPRTSINIIKDGNYLNLNYSPCKKEIEKTKIDDSYVCFDFPEEWKKIGIKDLDLDTNKNRRLIIKQFLDIVKKTSNKWLYLMGNKKVGKSYILAALANEFIRYNLGRVAVVNYPKLSSFLADISYSNKDRFNTYMNLLKNVPLLIIDDFGDEYKNEYVRDNITIPLLNDRASNNKLTFFSSEFSIKDVSILNSIGKYSGPIRGKQLQNTLNSMCDKEIDLTGTVIYS